MASRTDPTWIVAGAASLALHAGAGYALYVAPAITGDASFAGRVPNGQTVILVPPDRELAAQQPLPTTATTPPVANPLPQPQQPPIAAATPPPIPAPPPAPAAQPPEPISVTLGNDNGQEGVKRWLASDAQGPHQAVPGPDDQAGLTRRAGTPGAKPGQPGTPGQPTPQGDGGQQAAPAPSASSPATTDAAPQPQMPQPQPLEPQPAQQPPPQPTSPTPQEQEPANKPETSPTTAAATPATPTPPPPKLEQPQDVPPGTNASELPAGPDRQATAPAAASPVQASTPLLGPGAVRVNPNQPAVSAEAAADSAAYQPRNAADIIGPQKPRTNLPDGPDVPTATAPPPPPPPPATRPARSFFGPLDLTLPSTTSAESPPLMLLPELLPAAMVQQSAAAASQASTPSPAGKPGSPGLPQPTGDGGDDASSDAGDPGIQSDRESDAFSVAIGEYRAGKVIAGQGIEIRPTRPKFGLLARTLTMPAPPKVEVVFGRDGNVKRARIIRSSGYPVDIDEPIINALHEWTASGKALGDLPPVPSSELRLTLTVYLR